MLKWKIKLLQLSTKTITKGQMNYYELILRQMSDIHHIVKKIVSHQVKNKNKTKKSSDWRFGLVLQ